jgi:hypothetical protein
VPEVIVTERLTSVPDTPTSRTSVAFVVLSQTSWTMALQKPGDDVEHEHLYAVVNHRIELHHFTEIGT